MTEACAKDVSTKDVSTNEVSGPDLPLVPYILGINHHRRDVDVLFNEGIASIPNPPNVVVSCGGRDWKCHKEVLSKNCPFFQACLRGEFKEGDTGRVELADEDLHAVQAFLTLLYVLDNGHLVVWPFSHPNSIGDASVVPQPNIIMNIRFPGTTATSTVQDWQAGKVYAMADKYVVAQLEDPIKAAMMYDVSQCIRTITTAGGEKSRLAYRRLLYFIDMAYARDEYSVTRKVIVEALLDTVTDKALKYDGLQAKMLQYPEFGRDLVNEAVKIFSVRAFLGPFVYADGDRHWDI